MRPWQTIVLTLALCFLAGATAFQACVMRKDLRRLEQAVREATRALVGGEPLAP